MPRIDLRDSCRIELMVLTSSWIGTNTSYIDIHDGLLYGFEISWLHSYNRGGFSRSTWIDCYVDNDTNKVKCIEYGIVWLTGGDSYLNLIVFRLF
ncbi:hypothetical protein M0R45_036365 [Rubus argutus]|uniref:Uncharacterized protein n=1 Tax=Rubus argutus TaxID=59490 RepID=A0AAW1W0W5_RUBAR